MAQYKSIIRAAVISIVLAWIQFIVTSLALGQYLCYVDLLKHYPLFIFIKVLYFNNTQCGTTINVGSAITGMADQALVLTNKVPLTTSRTFLINAVYCPMSIIWIITSVIMLKAASRGSSSIHARWPWVVTMFITITMDIVVSVQFVVDTFYTKNLTSLVNYVNGNLSGAGTLTVDTSGAAWTMVILYSRLGVFTVINLGMLICVMCNCGSHQPISDTGSDTDKYLDDDILDEINIPRANNERRAPWSLEVFTRRRSPNPRQALHRLENMMDANQRRLEVAVVDTTGRAASKEFTQSMPHLVNVGATNESRTPTQRAPGRRDTAVELQGQLPWSYIPPHAHRMRDQLPEDEELPPVPVPDYTLGAGYMYRKASVHRAGSNVSVINQHALDDGHVQSKDHPAAQADVLY